MLKDREVMVFSPLKKSGMILPRMNRRNARFSVEPTSPCECCGRTADIDAVEPIGILEGADGKSSLILYQCRCENIRAIPWEQAHEAIKERAREANKDPANSRRVNLLK